MRCSTSNLISVRLIRGVKNDEENPFIDGIIHITMDWPTLVKPSTSRIVITVLLLMWVISAFPLVRERHILCYGGEKEDSILRIYTNPPMKRTDEYGENCYYRDIRITVFTWLRNNSEYQTEYKDEEWMRTTRIMNSDILWFLLVLPLTYVVSLPLKRIFNEARNGSREQVLTLLLITATLIPSIVINVCQPRALFSLVSVYAFPVFLLVVLPLSRTWGDVVILVILVLALGLVVFALKKFRIRNSIWYVLWVLYVITIYMGVVVVLFS